MSVDAPHHQETYVPRSPDAPPAATGPAGRADAAPAAGREVESREWRVESENASSPFLSTLYSPLSTSFPGLDAHGETPRSPEQLAGRVDDGSRQVAQTIGDLEASLARLFQTQIDALQRLSERALEQERRWVALAALRRSTP